MVRILVWLVSLTLMTPGMAEPLSIEQAIDRALVHAFEVKIADSELKAQKNRRVSSWLDNGPRLSATFNGALHDDKQTMMLGPKEVLVRDDLTKMGSLTLTQPITGLFGLVQNARLENSNYHLKTLNLKSTKAQLSFKVAELYLRAQKALKLLEVARLNLEVSLLQRKDGEALLSVGRIHHGDFLKLDLSVSLALSNEARARAERDVSLLSLLEIIHLPTKEVELISSMTPTLISAETLSSIDDYCALAYLNRLDVRQAEHGYDIAGIARSASYMKFFPSINFFMQVDQNFGKVGMAGKETSKMLGLNLSWDLWNNGAHFFAAREAHEKVVQARLQQDSVKLRIKLEVMESLSFLKAALEAFALSEKAVKQAEESYRIEKIKFQAGKSSATDLVISETAKATADSNYVAALSELKVREIKLQQSIGKLRPEF